MKEKQYALGFSLIPNVGPATLIKIKNRFESLEKAWHSDNANDFVLAKIKPSLANEIITYKKTTNLADELQALERENINFLSFWDEHYPQQLKEIGAAPSILYYRGNISLLEKKQLAIVGSRKITDYGKQVISKLIPDLVYAGLTITSGLAMGADSCAHQATLEAGGKTIAVLGSGMASRIIQSNFSYNLYEEIISQEGLVISEFPLFFEASKITFPARNRIISGLSLGTLIVEAAEKSGSLITAGYSLEQNREVFAVPGNIFSLQSAGTNKIIKEGAKCVTGANDILETLNFMTGQNIDRKDLIFEDPLEEKIYKTLSFEPIPIDTLVKKIAISPGELSAKISIMELKGLARTIGGGRVIRL